MSAIAPEKTSQLQPTWSRQISLVGAERAVHRHISAPVDVNRLDHFKTVGRVIQYSMSLSEMEPKQIYGPLHIGKSTFSRMVNGARGVEFPAKDVGPFCRLVGNNALGEWEARQIHCELRPLQSALERENAELRRELTEKEEQHEVLAAFVRKNIGNPRP